MILRFVCAISFGSKIAENGFKNDIFVVKMQVPSLKWVYSFPTRSLSNYRLDCVKCEVVYFWHTCCLVYLHVYLVNDIDSGYDLYIYGSVEFLLLIKIH